MKKTYAQLKIEDREKNSIFRAIDEAHTLTHDISLFPGHRNLLFYAHLSCVTYVSCTFCNLCTLIGPQ